MKKNWILRVALIILVLTLATACLLNGTFAKYVTSATGSDSARVAKWGITGDATTFNLFSKAYIDDLGQADTSSTSDEIETINTEDVFAPGSKGSSDVTFLYSNGIVPEVAFNLKSEVTIAVAGWNDYCPIVFTFNSKNFAWNNTDYFVSGTTTLQAELNTVLTGDASGVKNYGPNTTTLPASLTSTGAINLGWSWAFDSEDALTFYKNEDNNVITKAAYTELTAGDQAAYTIIGSDAKDTALGNLGVVPTINITIVLTATQNNTYVA